MPVDDPREAFTNVLGVEMMNVPQFDVWRCYFLGMYRFFTNFVLYDMNILDFLQRLSN